MNNRSSSCLIIGICTYRRPEGLRSLLNGIGRQSFSSQLRPAVSIVVVDNAGSEETGKICEDFRASFPSLPIADIREPCQGISHARNAVLKWVRAHECDYLALIDDDEIPCPEWLDKLLAMQKKSGSAVVRGPVVPSYSSVTPEWVKQGKYYGWPANPHSIADGQPLNSCSTGNVLMYWSAMRNHELSFDVRLAQTGGEDTVFFHRLKQAGYSIIYAADAVVTESIPAMRTTLPALLRLHFRLGANRFVKHYCMLNEDSGQWPLFQLIGTQTGKAVRHLGKGILLIMACWVYAHPSRNIKNGLLEIARAVGQFAGLFGVSYRYYR